jgi:hypothetical protein
MTIRTQRDSLKVQLLDTQRLRDLAKDHPVMSLAFEEREKELRQKLEALPLAAKEARAVLFFSGEPVQGSFGIDASFAGRILEPFQNMVMADYADRWHGVVGSRGRRRGESESRLLLTALPRGSFGLELVRAENDELFEEDQLSDSLAHVTKLVESAARSDEDFAAELDDTAPRVIQNLREFLEVVAKGRAGLRLETGDFRCSLDTAEASSAYDRVAGTITNDEDVEIFGILKGVLLESWKFDFLTSDGLKISGKVDTNLTVEEVEKLAVTYFNKSCKAIFVKTGVLFKNGRVRTSYTLKNLGPAEQTTD